MVAAGVYMLCRVLFLLNAPALTVISWVGGFTALLAIALKRQIVLKLVGKHAQGQRVEAFLAARGFGDEGQQVVDERVRSHKKPFR